MKGHGRLHIEYKKNNIQHLEDPDRNRRILKYIYILLLLLLLHWLVADQKTFSIVKLCC